MKYRLPGCHSPPKQAAYRRVCCCLQFAVTTAAVGCGLMHPTAADANPPIGGYQLLWSSQFNGSSLNPLKWNFGQPWGSNVPPGSDSIGEPGNVTITNNTLNLTAQRQATDGYGFTTGLVNTGGKLNFTYGYVEAEIQTPYTLGTWPAFWMLQNGWPPEIDVMEAPQQSYNNQAGSVGTAYDYYATYHYTAANGAAASVGTGMHYTGVNEATSFNNYGMMWTPDSITFYFNGNPIYTVNGSTANIAQSNNMYLLLDLAVGGWPGEPPSWASFPATMQIRNVNVWQLAPSTMTMNWAAGNSIADWNSSGSWNGGRIPLLGSETAVFGQTAANSTSVQWSNFIGVGNIVTNGGRTNYTFGRQNQSGLMLANDSGTASITLNSLNKLSDNVAFNAELDLYNNTNVINNLATPVNFTGAVYGEGALNVFHGRLDVYNRISNSGGINIDNGGVLNLTGGSIDTPGSDLNVTTQPGDSGTLLVSSPPDSINASVIRIGGYNGGNALYIQQSGTVTSQTWFVIGQSANADGTASLTGGTLNIRAAAGLNGDLELGVFNSASGVMTLSGTAAINLWNNANIILGSRGTTGNGTVNQDGGSVEFYADSGLTPGGSGQLILGRLNSTGIYTYNLNGGVLAVNAVTSSSGESYFNFNGGTLEALSDNSRFIAGLTAVNIQGGGNINAAGHAVTLSQQIIGTGGLTLYGGGAITLPTANLYSGGTNVRGTTLVLAASAGSATGSGPVTISLGGILTGTGTIAGAVATISSGAAGSQNGEIMPLGAMNIHGGLTLADNSILSFPDVATTPNMLTVNAGSLTLGRDIHVVLSGPMKSGIYGLIAFSGTLSGAANLGTWTVTDSAEGNVPITFAASPQTGELNLLVNVAAVPEPSSLAIAILGAAAICLPLKRRVLPRRYDG